MPTSMILRFRDLAGPIGSTIDRHRAIIDAHGGVWWAWWSKPNERIPRQLFADFREVIRRNGDLLVYLADSGRHLLYRARVVDIQESGTEEPIPSPNPDQTPEYYRATPYKAWLRISVIEAVDPGAVEGDLRQWSYDEVAEFTDDPFALSFQDKRIFGIDEVLNRRHRTIYFIQPVHAGHRTHLVEALPRVQPKNFIVEPIAAQSSFILHLSDLHFGPHHRFALNEAAPGGRSLARLIIDDLRTELRLGAPALVAITGDLTWQARDEEFVAAQNFIERLRSEFALEGANFIVVPGNHDIRWSGDPAAKDSRVEFAPAVAKRPFHHLYEAVFGIPPNQYFSHGRRALLANFQTVDVIGLSSTELEGKAFAGYGYVTAEQLRGAMTEMGWLADGPRTSYRIVALHHHVTTVVPEEEIRTYDKSYSITLDAGHLIYECLNAGVDMVIHGHQHQPFTGVLGRIPSGGRFRAEGTLVVNASGSAGVRHEDIPSGRNTYTIYELTPNGIRIRVRRFSDARVGYEPALEWSSSLKRNPSGGLSLSNEPIA
jgi:3',5'-cyclic AMP phosphodiesterase CpdA